MNEEENVVYRSVYGTTVIPENLNFFNAAFPDAYGLPMTSSNKLAYARQLKVVRDAVASFYFHLFLDRSILMDFIGEMRAMGYTFTDAEALLSEEPAH